MHIKKAVIPVAGKGTRFLPATKHVPKEMIPILKRPMIHFIVEEAVRSGIEHIIFVTSCGKGIIEDYFDRHIELESFLAEKGKQKELSLIKEIGSMTEITSIRQKEQLGLGHAVLCAKNVVGDEPFVVLLGDDIIVSQNPVTKQLMDCSMANNGGPVIGVMEVPASETNKYGIIDGQVLAEDKKTLLMNRMIEKPAPHEAPTRLATPGRYVLSPEIFSCLEKIPRGVGGEYQLTDAINLLCKNEKVFAHIFEGKRYDTGSIEGYLDATFDFALEDQETRSHMLNLIRRYNRDYGEMLK